MANPNTQNVIATTQERWLKTVTVDNFSDNHEVLKRLMINGQKANVDGGEYLAWTMDVQPMLASTTNVFLAPGGAFTNSAAGNPSDFLRKVRVDWKHAGFTHDIPTEDTEIFNRGPERVINILTGNFDNMFKSLRDITAATIQSSTVGGLSARNTLLFTSIPDIMDVLTVEYPDNSGITEAAFPASAPLRVNKANTVLTISDVEDRINEIRMIRGGKADLVVVNINTYNNLKNEIHAGQRFVNVSTNTKTEAGIPSFQINGADVIADADIPAGRAYVLSTDDWFYIPRPRGEMEGFRTMDSIFFLSKGVNLSDIDGNDVRRFLIRTDGELGTFRRRTSCDFRNVA